MFISGCGLLSDADQKIYSSKTRQPEELEYLYLALASEMHSIKPCYLIHPDSLRKAAFHAVGSQVTLIRSGCFFAVAGASGDAQLCDKVRSASTVFLSGAATNADSCRRGASTQAGISYNLDLPKIVALAGYSEEEVDAFLVSAERFSSIDAARSYRLERSSTYWGEVRRNLLHSTDFFERIGHLPGFGTAVDHTKMSTLEWKPRPQRQWVLPEKRAPSIPEIKSSALPDS